jgi:hypothetical protein
MARMARTSFRQIRLPTRCPSTMRSYPSVVAEVRRRQHGGFERVGTVETPERRFERSYAIAGADDFVAGLPEEPAAGQRSDLRLSNFDGSKVLQGCLRFAREGHGQRTKQSPVELR